MLYFASEEMEQFHKETEANLNRTVATLKQQMSEDEKEKKRVELDKMAAQSVAHSLDASNRDLQGQVRARLFHKYPYLRNFSPKKLSCKYFQVQSLKQQILSLQREMDQEKMNFKAQVAVQVEKQRHLQV